MIRDDQEEIAEIIWRVDGKIKEIIRTPGSTRDNLQFEYDALGNRIAKHSYDNSNLWLKSTFYIRDAQGNVISVYNKEPDGVNINHQQIEKHIYGSSRLGMDVNVTEMIGAVTPTEEFEFSIGDKQYECSNHLGNVLAVITDKKFARDDNTDLVIDYFQPEVISSQDYSPFGVLLEERNWSSEQYRYGFNGMEKDDEVKGNGNHYDFGARCNDTRLGRWLSIDPLHAKFPNGSPYMFAANGPIIAIDPNGRDIYITSTDPVFVSNALAALQLMTDRELEVLEDGRVVVVNEIPDFEDNNEADQLLSTLLEPEYTIRINEGTKNSNSFDAETGEGDAGWAMNDLGLRIKNEDGTTGRDPAIGLTHELIHIYLTITTDAETMSKWLEAEVPDPDWNNETFMTGFEYETRVLDSWFRENIFNTVARADGNKENVPFKGIVVFPEGKSWQDISRTQVFEMYKQGVLIPPDGLSIDDIDDIYMNRYFPKFLNILSTKGQEAAEAYDKDHGLDSPEQILYDDYSE